MNGQQARDRHDYGLLRRVRHRHLFVLAVLVIFVLALPLVERGSYSSPLASLLFTFLVVPTVFASGRNARWIGAGLALATPSILCAVWMLVARPTSATTIAWLERVSLSSMVVFLGLTVVVMLFHLQRARAVDDEILASAVGVYLVVGFFFAVVYQLFWLFGGPCVDGMTVDGSAQPPLSEFVYFSLMTQTTVGYGDMVPAGEFVRSVTIIQAVMGQLYLVVLVARLVALHAGNRRDDVCSDEDFLE